MSEEKKTEAVAASVSAEDVISKKDFQKMAKEHLAQVEALQAKSLKEFRFNSNPETAKQAKKATEAKSLAQWMVAYGQNDVKGMKTVTQDFVADTGTALYAGNLVHPVFEEMVHRFTNLHAPIYRDSRKVTLRRNQGNTFNTQSLIADVVATWGAEGAAKNVTRASFSRDTVKLDKLQGIVIMTDELGADAFTDFPSFIAERMARQMSIQLETGLLIGNGANTDGILNTAGVTFYDLASTNLSAFSYDDLLRMKIEYGKQAESFTNGKAYLSWDIYGNILLAKDNEGAYLVPNTNPSGVSPDGVTPAFLGQVPYTVAPRMPADGQGAGDPIAIYADLSSHSIVVEKEGMEVLYSQHGSATFTDDASEEVTVNAYQQDLTLGRFVRRVAGLVVNPAGVIVARLATSS